MVFPNQHSFHIPVLGIGYSIDTPLKVARFGISSVISIMDDELIEKMRMYHALKAGIACMPISKYEDDHRAKRITAYLNLVQELVNRQVATIKKLPFEPNNDLSKYFEMLPDNASAKSIYREMCRQTGGTRDRLETQLRNSIVPGDIDVNIMAKVDKINSDHKGNALPAEFSDALSSLRGFAKSNLCSSVVLSAGYNPRLYNYIEQFEDFYPQTNGGLKKKIILKVSDFRSALVQGKIFAKKGLWVSEFRIESGLNCGGHAFATDGLLLGPILEEFKNRRAELQDELLNLCNTALHDKNKKSFETAPSMRITVQGGIGTSQENDFLLEYYELDGTGWGSPFLLVPEATNVDDETRNQMATAKKEDYYLSHSSPLGIPFNNFRKSSAEKQRVARIEKGQPGSPCYKKHLISNTEFTEIPICTASRQYQHLKIKQLKEKQLPEAQYQKELNAITEKDCLCEGLGAPALLSNHLPMSHKLSAVTICPGPNLAYFSGIFSLSQMVGHIYGRNNILNSLPRPHMFINELRMYIDYYKDKLEHQWDAKQLKYLQVFKTNLLAGIEYYKQLIPQISNEADKYIASMKNQLLEAFDALNGLNTPTAELKTAVSHS